MDDVNFAIRPLAEDFVKEVNLDLNDIRNSFFRIGFRLYEANEYKYYKDFGFDNISDCAESLFGFKKTTTYDLMKIYCRFHNRDMPLLIDRRYDKFSQSQLLSLCSVNSCYDTFISYVSSDDTVETIKKASKLWNALYSGKIVRKRNVRYTTLQEFIDIYSLSETNVLPVSTIEYVAEKSNKDSVYTENENIDLSVNNSETADILVNNDFNLYDFMYSIFKEFITRMGYKVSFIDSKGMPLRVLPDDFAMSLASAFFRNVNKNPTVLKKWIKNIVLNGISLYDYEILLCGRHQNFQQFCGNVGTFICDEINDEYLKKHSSDNKKSNGGENTNV